jgi:hypothetical protein
MRIHAARSIASVSFFLLGIASIGCGTNSTSSGSSGGAGGSGGSSQKGGTSGTTSGKGGAPGTGGNTGSGGTTSSGGGGTTVTGGSSGSSSTPSSTPVADAAAPAVDVGSDATPGAGGWANCASIFDGKTFDGWEDGIASWTIVEGAFRSKAAAGRGQIGTKKSYKDFRLIYSIREIEHGGHNPCTLIWGRKHLGGDAFGGAYQFQLPTPFGWNYVSNGDLGLKKAPDAPTIDLTKWAQCEILARATGTVRVACCQQDATGNQPCKASELILPYTNANAPFEGPLGFQLHNQGMVNEYKNICVEENPTADELITTK